jgi:hypothetical protein
MFVTAMVTLAGPLPANMPFTFVTPLAFSLSDGVQTITTLNAINTSFFFATGPTGMITLWQVSVDTGPPPSSIDTLTFGGNSGLDVVNTGIRFKAYPGGEGGVEDVFVDLHGAAWVVGRNHYTWKTVNGTDLGVRTYGLLAEANCRP